MKIEITLDVEDIAFYGLVYLYYRETSTNKINLKESDMSTKLKTVTRRLKIKAFDEN
jgi:hypothetical protein